jgi:hypothetical protein
MANNPIPFDNTILQAVDDVHATGTENDDELLQLLQSISDIATVSDDVADSKVNTTSGLNAKNVKMSRVIKLPTTEEVDIDFVKKMVKSYEEDAKLANTLVAFANDRGVQREKQADSSQFMKELTRAAIPQIVARSVMFPALSIRITPVVFQGTSNLFAYSQMTNLVVETKYEKL